ncbi:hypothetical protein ADK61_22305 [Streptomyces sp. XY66]|uniref:hypothetical protein n=1 Tax=Streptomyces sp. XY66 TaxID=1415563 RepID=UPI0006AE6658|nr:hypothetical protein [Streptomyces sp. XY66]KOU73725.1 hypothetical protein ADK61_22305 [Streptomyces sp. XY66]
MGNQLPGPTAFIGPIGRGKASLPGDADADQYAAVLRRALHTVECRELGPEAACQKFGPFADNADGRVTVLVGEDQIQDRDPGHDELSHLTRAVRERGPAVDVFMVPPTPTMLFMDEMAHVASKAAEHASGPALAGRARWVYEPSLPLRPIWWSPTGEAADER